VTITPSYDAGGDITADAVLQFISEHGTVKTVSQPQLTVLSGSSASLAVEQSQNFVSGVSRTPSTTVGVPDTVSLTTDTVQTGLTMDVTSSWDQSTVYGTVNISLDELLDLDVFTADDVTTIQLPQTTTREISTQIRVRPGDAVLIAGLVTERDDYNASGPGILKPFLQTARSASVRNTELVFLLRPRVIAFVPGTDEDTVEIIDAPRQVKRKDADSDKYVPANVTDDVGALFGNAGAATGADADAPAAEEDFNAPLPEGISPAALAPAPAEPVMMPQEAAPPVALTPE
jgi:type II secretory pathway component GspD/PulD (secretin)